MPESFRLAVTVRVGEKYKDSPTEIESTRAFAVVP